LRPDSEAYLADVRAAGEHLVRLTADIGADALAGSSDLARLIERYREIVGEALRRLRDADEETFRTIRMGAAYVALRNVIAHGYDVINHEIILNTCRTELPLVLEDVQRLLEPYDQHSDDRD
jgi:uncharacterized protein with HEPN domain